jgi:hypothetical protein
MPVWRPQAATLASAEDAARTSSTSLPRTAAEQGWPGWLRLRGCAAEEGPRAGDGLRDHPAPFLPPSAGKPMAASDPLPSACGGSGRVEGASVLLPWRMWTVGAPPANVVRARCGQGDLTAGPLPPLSSSSDGGPKLGLSGHCPISLPTLLSVDVAGAIFLSLCCSRRHLFLPLLATMARSSNCRPRGGVTLLTDKRCIHLRSASVWTYTFFTTGFPRFLSIRGARGLQAFDPLLLTNYSHSNYDKTRKRLHYTREND